MFQKYLCLGVRVQLQNLYACELPKWTKGTVEDWLARDAWRSTLAKDPRIAHRTYRYRRKIRPTQMKTENQHNHTKQLIKLQTQQPHRTSQKRTENAQPANFHKQPTSHRKSCKLRPTRFPHMKNYIHNTRQFSTIRNV